MALQPLTVPATQRTSQSPSRYLVVSYGTRAEIIGTFESEGDAEACARSSAQSTPGHTFAVFQNIGQAALIPQVQWSGARL